MTGERSENQADDMNRNETLEDRGFKSLLAHDRQLIHDAAVRRVATGMYGRIAQAVKEDRDRRAFVLRWPLVYAGAIALVMIAFWIGMTRKTISPTPNVAVQHTPASATAKPSQAITANMPVSTKHPRRHAVRSSIAAANRVPLIVSRQSVFPANVAPSEQERLLMEMAQNHPDQLAVIAEQMADDSRQVEEQRQAFEQWIKKGGKI